MKDEMSMQKETAPTPPPSPTKKRLVLKARRTVYGLPSPTFMPLNPPSLKRCNAISADDMVNDPMKSSCMWFDDRDNLRAHGFVRDPEGPEVDIGGPIELGIFEMRNWRDSESPKKQKSAGK